MIPEEAHPSEFTLDAWRAGTLPAARVAEIEAHVATCDRCSAWLARFSVGLDAVPGLDRDAFFRLAESLESQRAAESSASAPSLVDRSKAGLDRRGLGRLVATATVVVLVGLAVFALYYDVFRR